MKDEGLEEFREELRNALVFSPGDMFTLIETGEEVMFVEDSKRPFQDEPLFIFKRDPIIHGKNAYVETTMDRVTPIYEEE